MTPARAVMVTLVVLALLTAGGLGIYKLAQPNLSCGAGVQYRGAAHECTGVTDGSVVFYWDLRKVEIAILKENHRVDREHVPHATVALLMPFNSPDPTSREAILHVVQGAYIAQLLANHSAISKAPLIRLVLANPGQDSRLWRPVAKQLETMIGSPDNLRAVTGIGSSTSITQREVGWLTKNGIPVVGGSITADDIANTPNSDPFPGLVRVAPTNTDEAKALINYAKEMYGKEISKHVISNQMLSKHAVLVEDTRAGDDYISTLKKAFTVLLPDMSFPSIQFGSPPNISQNGTTSNQFTQYVQSICPRGSSVNWIFFAGRQVQLRQFLIALAGTCPQHDFNVLTGDAASHLAGDTSLSHVFKNITLYYAALASPDAWRNYTPPGNLKQQYTDSNTAYGVLVKALLMQKARIGLTNLTDLADGQLIINYDAVRTAIAAIKNMTLGVPMHMPKLRDISDEWRALYGAQKIKGVSGWICLESDGNPYDKAISIVRYNSKFGATPVYVQLAWPDNNGLPPSANQGLCIVG